MEDAFRDGIGSLLWQLTTGGGKTVVFAEFVDREVYYEDALVLILAHRDEIMQHQGQNYSLIAEP
jgi:superfamily II DNA or RNA helicase